MYSTVNQKIGSKLKLSTVTLIHTGNTTNVSSLTNVGYVYLQMANYPHSQKPVLYKNMMMKDNVINLYSISKPNFKISFGISQVPRRSED